MRRSRAENGGVFKGGLGRELGRRGEKESFGGMVVFIRSSISHIPSIFQAYS
ncbi:hypothetical protein HanXRQr2_Chr16g0730931 [Helianthus annuus]|uniref:Uncharacterized protein n=1 Tax=Helianthus annuus TaxID=4232 RepID=A0A9K3DQW2_HELAN|nr:hypothetical protein HanXRQr2_Chr16g0730931 [Helianthus annuus]KAJ0819856.1 hypothetical protein HanPSC8_Chr16g0700911 [Helianthus annuus]